MATQKQRSHTGTTKIREMPHNFLLVVNAALILQIYCPAVFTFSKLAMETTEEYEKSV